MRKKREIIAFIPARSGSTRIKNKNITLLNGKPLIYWAVFKALKSKKFDKIIFSSDSNKYFNILIKFLKKDKIKHKNLIFDKRNLNHTKTKSKIFDYIKFDFIKKFGLKKNDLIVQLLPTCPLRSIISIKKTINFSLINEVNCFSVCEYDFHLSFGLSINGNKWRAVFSESPLVTGSTQSQSQKKYFHPTGVINCLHVKFLSKQVRTIYHKATPVILPRSESFDLDTKDDLKILKKIFG